MSDERTETQGNVSEARECEERHPLDTALDSLLAKQAKLEQELTCIRDAIQEREKARALGAIVRREQLERFTMRRTS
mgnify:CR=1 FL=1